MNNFKFKKKYGQNFLIDKNVVNKIVKDIVLENNSMALEIGCGDGKLTNILCQKFNYVLGYEIDLEVKDYLLENLKNYNNFNIIFDDFLKRDITKDIKYNYDVLKVSKNESSSV